MGPSQEKSQGEMYNLDYYSKVNNYIQKLPKGISAFLLGERI